MADRSAVGGPGTRAKRGWAAVDWLRLPLWGSYPGTVAMVPRAAAAGAALLLALVGGRMLMNQRTPDGNVLPPRVARSQSAPRQDYQQLHGPYQFGQAMGRDDAIILASDMVMGR